MAEYYLVHVGVSKEDGAPGRGSGRYPLGSGKRPFQGKPQEAAQTAKKMSRRQRAKELKKANAKSKDTQTVDKPSEPEFTDEMKADIIARGDLKAAFKNMEHFSNKDIDDVILRNEKQKKLTELAVPKVKSGQEKINDLIKKVNQVATAGEAAISVYNTAARIYNAFGSKELPTIKGIDKYADRSKRAEEAAKKLEDNKKKQLEAIVRSGDLEKVLASRKNLTNAQLREAHDRKAIIDNIEKLLEKEKVASD